MSKTSPARGYFEKSTETWLYVLTPKDARALLRAERDDDGFPSIHALLTALPGLEDVPFWLDHNPTIQYVVDPEEAPADLQAQVARIIDDLVEKAHRLPG